MVCVSVRSVRRPGAGGLLLTADPFEGSIASTSRGQQVIAGMLARAIERYFAPARAMTSPKRATGPSRQPPGPPQPEPTALPCAKDAAIGGRPGHQQ